MMVELAVSSRTAAQLRRVADQTGTTAEALAEQALRQFLQEEARRAIQRETEAFRAMHSELLQAYGGQYVAVYQGQVVDHDPDRLALYLRINQQFPDVPVLMTQVLAEPEKVYTFRSPRIMR